ncbi:hypothetical protein Avbf_09115 [Armadillidium vulgare]|nr:hypothetical protein Avbf_09115 [Armadillidium vulgare]
MEERPPGAADGVVPSLGMDIIVRLIVIHFVFTNSSHTFTSVSYYLLVINSFICSTYHFVEYIIPNLCLSVSKRNTSVSIISEELYFNDFCEYLCFIEFGIHLSYISSQ